MADLILWLGSILAVCGLTVLVLSIPAWRAKRNAELRAKQPGILRAMLDEEAKRRGEKHEPKKPPSDGGTLNLRGV